MTKELRFNKQKITDRRANNFEKKNWIKIYTPLGPPGSHQPPGPPAAAVAAAG